jgi:hypothetical protein
VLPPFHPRLATDVGQTTAVTSVVVILTTFVIAGGLFGILEAALMSSESLLVYLDLRRPAFVQVPLGVHVEAQLFNLEVAARNVRDRARIVPIVGSSSVVNGVDVDLVNKSDDRGRYRAVNFGLTGLTAYELPLLHRYLLPEGRETVVLAYNPWMFGNSIHPQAVVKRWSTVEAVKIFRLMELVDDDLNAYFTGALSEWSFLLRYRGFLKAQFIRWLAGTLEIRSHPYDYAPGLPVVFAGSLTRPVPISLLDRQLRRWCVESARDGDTLGWRGLRRFLRVATGRGVSVVVVPVPVMPSDGMMYLQGIDLAGIDRRIELESRRAGIRFVSRRELPAFEDQDFVDPVHLHDEGRKRYSLWLGNVIREMYAGGSLPLN